MSVKLARAGAKRGYVGICLCGSLQNVAATVTRTSNISAAARLQARLAVVVAYFLFSLCSLSVLCVSVVNKVRRPTTETQRPRSLHR